MPRKSIQERFWEKVDIKSEPECWEWRGSCFVSGYGAFNLNKKTVRAHRVAYELTYGEIPEGFDILHTCDIRPCCNPSHLFKGTDLDNAHDRDIKGRWRCGDRRGSCNGSHKLTETDVIEIRNKINLGYTLKCLSIQYGVTSATINYISNRKTWKHI